VILTGQTRLGFGSVWFNSVHFGRMRRFIMAPYIVFYIVGYIMHSSSNSEPTFSKLQWVLGRPPSSNFSIWRDGKNFALTLSPEPSTSHWSAWRTFHELCRLNVVRKFPTYVATQWNPVAVAVFADTFKFVVFIGPHLTQWTWSAQLIMSIMLSE